MLTERTRTLDQLDHQRLADSAAALIGLHINRVFDGVPIAVERAIVAERGVAEHLVAVDRHDHRVTRLTTIGEPLPAIVDVDESLVPDRRGVLDGVVVDRGDRLEIGLGRIADVHARSPVQRWRSERNRHDELEPNIDV